MSILNVSDDRIITNIELYKNIREPLGIIPLDWIVEIKDKFADISELSLKIPKYKMRDNLKVENRLYNLIKSRQQIVITETNRFGEQKQTRYVLGTQKRSTTKYKGDKEFTAYSWEKKLDWQRINFSESVKQLKSTNVDKEEGILDLIASKTGWHIGYVDEDARCKYVDTVDITKIDLFNNYIINDLSENGLIFEKVININAPDDKPVYLTFNYNQIKTYDTTDGKELTNVDVQNTLDEAIHETITKIQAYQLNATNNRNGIRYKFTLSDGTVIQRDCTFTNVLHKQVSVTNINIEYDYGDIVKKFKVQYNSFEAFNDSAYKLLNNLRDLFDCYFLYNTMTKTINCYAKKNYGENQGFLLSLDTNVVKIETTQAESIPTALKVTGKDNLSIAGDNPEGNDTIHNYNYYINNDIISDELKSSLVKYNTLLTQKQDEWNVLKNNRTIIQQKATKVSSELRTIKSQIATLEQLLSAYVASNDSENQARTKSEKDTLITRKTQLEQMQTEYSNSLNDIDDNMTKISQEIKKENATLNGVKVFDDEDLEELREYEEVFDYSDNYYSDSYALYDNAVKVLADKVKPTNEFTLTTEHLNSMIHHPNGWTYVLKLGNLLNFNDKETISEIGTNEVRLTEITRTPTATPDGKTKLQIKELGFSNKTDRIDFINTHSNTTTVQLAKRSDGKLKRYSPNLKQIEATTNFVKTALDTGIDTQQVALKGETNNSALNISGSSITSVDKSDSTQNKQMQLIGGSLCSTKDSWETSKVLINSNGMIGLKELLNNADNLTPTNPITIDCYIDESVKEIYSAILRLRCRNFRHENSISEIVDGDLASSLAISVNNTKVIDGLGDNSDVEIKDYLVSGQWNEIKIESVTNGRVSYNLTMKSFNEY